MRAPRLLPGLVALAVSLVGGAYGASERRGLGAPPIETNEEAGEATAAAVPVGDAAAAIRRRLELLEGDAFKLATKTNKCLTAKSKRGDTLIRPGRVKLKRCKSDAKTKNKARWKVEASQIVSVLKDEEDIEYCLSVRTVEEKAKLITEPCDLAVEWDVFPAADDEDKILITGTDTEGVDVEFGVNKRAKLEERFDQNDLEQVPDFVRTELTGS